MMYTYLESGFASVKGGTIARSCGLKNLDHHFVGFLPLSFSLGLIDWVDNRSVFVYCFVERGLGER